MDQREYLIGRITQHQQNKDVVTKKDLENFIELVDSKIDEISNIALGPKHQTEHALSNSYMTIITLKIMKHVTKKLIGANDGQET